MMKRYTAEEFLSLPGKQKSVGFDRAVEDAVEEIIRQVTERGDDALREYTEKFDRVKLSSLAVSESEITEAYNRTDKYFIETLELAKKNITAFHERQLKDGYRIEENGMIAGQRYTPIERVGVYVPSGTASYPSTVLMNLIPAKIAGVKKIVMVTPSNKEGKIPDAILTAAKIAGATEIFKIGGAQAIAALAYGTESVPKVDKIVGPGNAYVAAAKRRVFGEVAIDMIAGPSDIAIIADGNNEAETVAADLLSQAEHDVNAAAVLITTSAKLADEVQEAVERRLCELNRERIARKSIENNGKIIVAKTLEEATHVADALAPEHLELCVEEPFELLKAVKNAGSIFLGKNTPEALGDYLAGPNHTLPTNGTARFSSPLSVDDFVKKSSFLYYTRERLAEVKDRIIDFAEREGLQAHGKSVAVRFEGEE